MKPSTSSRGLGRGLASLLSDNVAEQTTVEGKVQLLNITKLQPGALQPRRIFNEDALQELSVSIAERGILQPLLVRKVDAGQYEILAGERRWRAAQLAGLHEVPVIVRTFTDAECLEIGLIENLQREDLNPIEEAEGYQNLMDHYQYTQEKIAQFIGKSRPHIANVLRLNQLIPTVKNLLQQGVLSAGHGRQLVNHPNALELAQIVVDKGLSVRQLEQLVRSSKKPTVNNKHQEKSPDALSIERNLTSHLGLKVALKQHAKGNRGQIVIDYENLDQFDTILTILRA